MIRYTIKMPSAETRLFLLAFGFAHVAAPQASGQVSVGKAKQLLISHLQAPDRKFEKECKSYKTADGHLEYEFHGDNGGSYRIDAVCGSKSIDHARRSKLKIWEKVKDNIPSEKLLQIALDYAKDHFPGYDPRQFSVSSGPCDGGAYNLYDVELIFKSPSGAELPSVCRMEVEEDTGSVGRYEEVSIPVTINTSPSIKRERAIAIGQEWIRQNVTLNPEKAQVLGPPEQFPIRLKVDVDPLLIQTLLYEIRYRGTVLQIDAQSGAVISKELYASSDDGPRQNWGKSAKNPEVLWEAQFPNGARLTHDAIEVAGAVFIWHKYAESIGFEVRRGAESVELVYKGKRLRLLLTRECTGSKDGAWLRNGELYLPVDVVTRLTDLIRLDSNARVVTVAHPYAFPPNDKSVNTP